MVTISTAGARLDSPLGVLRARAHELGSFRRDSAAKHNVSRSDDGSFVVHEWCLEQTEDPDDLKLVVKANPASWQTLEALRRRHDSPSMTPWAWRRFACGIWTEGEEPWIDPTVWDALREPGMTLDSVDPVVLGVDVGVRQDSTAIVAVSQRSDGRLGVQATILLPPPGGALPLRVVEEAIRELCGRYDVRGIAFDPWSFRRSAELLDQEGYPMVEFPQSPERMAHASANLYRVIESGGLVHDGDPALRSHVMAGVTKETERGWRLQKDPRRSAPIDALIALAMAVQVASAASPAEPMVAFA
jgi:phage terminase large subunit-like protein